MGCGTSMHKGDTVGAPQAVAEAEELQRLREENAELKRQNANLTTQVQEHGQRLNTITMDLAGLRNDLTQAAATATKALQVAQTATERAEAASLAAAAAAQARPATATGPIPIPGPEAQVSVRIQQLESQVSALQDKLEGQKAKEEFAKQLRAAQGERAGGLPLAPQGSGGSNNSSLSAAAVGGGGGSGRHSGATDLGGTPPPVIDGSGLLPANNNFPSRFGGGPAGLRPARDRTPGRSGAPTDMDMAGHGGGGGSGLTGGGGSAMMQTLVPGPPGGELMSTHRYGNVLPSDLKFAEQRKQGPKQFL